MPVSYTHLDVYQRQVYGGGGIWFKAAYCLGEHMKLKEMKDWQRKKLLFSLIMILVIACTFLSITCSALYQDKMAENGYWYSALKVPEDLQLDVAELGADATKVTTGTYIENLKEINLKGCNFRVVFLTWFKWEGNEDLDMMNNCLLYTSRCV